MKLTIGPSDGRWLIMGEEVVARETVATRQPRYAVATTAAGIDNVHTNDGSPVFRVVGTLTNSSGSAVGDFDRDGCEDIFLAGSPTEALFLVGSVLLLLFMSVVVLATRFRREHESTLALRGAVIARRLGCFACHGSEGKGGDPRPRRARRHGPGWDGSTVATYARDEQEIREWILDGAPQRLAKSGIADGRPAGIPMPAYRGRISSQELADLLVYFRAVSA